MPRLRDLTRLKAVTCQVAGSVTKAWRRLRIWHAERKVAALYQHYLRMFQIHVNAECARRRELPIQAREAKVDFNRALDKLRELDPETNRRGGGKWARMN